MATNLQLRIFLAGLLGALLTLLLVTPDARSAAQEKVDQSPGVAPHAAGELLIVYEAGINAAAADRLPEETEGEIEEEIPEIDTQVVEFPEVKNESTEQEREELLQQKKEELKKDPAVQSVSYNFIYKGAYTPNDDRFEDQYGLKRIQAPQAWNRVRGGGVDIAIVDTGISNTHPDLERKISGQANCINDSADDLSCVEGPESAEDDSGHGTRVAGVAAASTNNDEGVAGACPNCRLLIAKSLNSNNDGTASDVAGGIIWATDEGAEVINLSLGAEEADAPPVKKAINRAQHRGAVVVASAGNYGGNSKTVYPAAYKNVVAVAATDRNNRRVSNSSTGNWVDVSAPGVDVLSTKYRKVYERFSGTSMSSPFVAGVAGLLSDQGRSAKEIRRRINTTAVDLGPTGKDDKYGHGLVDAAAAVGIPTQRLVPNKAAPRISNPRPAPGSTVKSRRPNISATLRDAETNLRKKNATLILDRKKKGAFRYDKNRNRLSYKPTRNLAPGKHTARIVVRDGQGKKTSRKWRFTVKSPKPPNNNPLRIVNSPGFPFNVLPNDPIFDIIRN
jgi:thermitase